MANLTQLTNTRAIVDANGVLSQEARLYFQQLTLLVPISGKGSPEGVVSAIQGATYYDLDGSTNSIHYVKKFAEIGGDNTKGWVLA